MEKTKNKNDCWVLMYAPFTHILPNLEFQNKKEAIERAKEENRIGIYKGRGVKAVRLSYLLGKTTIDYEVCNKDSCKGCNDCE